MPDNNELGLSSPPYVGRNWGLCDAVAQSRQSKGFVLYLLGCAQLMPPLLLIVCVLVTWQREELVLSLPGQECKRAVNWRRHQILVFLLFSPACECFEDSVNAGGQSGGLQVQVSWVEETGVSSCCLWLSPAVSVPSSHLGKIQALAKKSVGWGGWASPFHDALLRVSGLRLKPLYSEQGLKSLLFPLPEPAVFSSPFCTLLCNNCVNRGFSCTMSVSYFIWAWV